MSTEMNRSRIMIILIFALTFAIVGWVSPVLYASNVPQSQVIEVHEFTAQDTTTTADEHYICFDRTVHKPSTAETYTELYLLDDNGNRIEIESTTRDDYFQGGRHNVILPLDLPNDLAEGEYRYVFVSKFDLADGRVDRTFEFKSQTFTVNDSVSPPGDYKEAVKSC